MTKFVGVRAKTCSYLIDDDSEHKKTKGKKKCVINRKLKFENYENCLDATQLKNKMNHLENIKLTQVVSKKPKKTSTAAVDPRDLKVEVGN